MPTNTILGTNPVRIAKLTLDALRTMPFKISSITTDFSNETASSGDTVTTRFVSNPVTQDFNASKSASNSSTTAVSTVLQHYLGVALGFSDKEMAFSDIALTDMYIKPALTALFVNIWDNVAQRVTATNFPNFTVCNAANFNAANVANIGTNLTTANVLQYGRQLVINPAMALTLKRDTALQASYAYGNNQVIAEGSVPRVYGFDVTEFNGTIPTNGSQLIGWGCRPQALVMATRIPATPRNWYGVCENITDPLSGITFQYRDYYDGAYQKTELCLIYGTQVGVPGNLWRIQSS